MIKPLLAHTLNLSAEGDLMQKTFRFLEIALISLTLAACVVLYTVGLDHADLGYEGDGLIPCFCPCYPRFVSEHAYVMYLDRKIKILKFG